jgi:hypothetical protein
MSIVGFLLYLEYIVALLMLLLIVVQLSNDVLSSVPMTTTLISFVVVFLSVDLMWFESIHVTTNLIKYEFILVVAAFMLA